MSDQKTVSGESGPHSAAWCHTQDAFLARSRQAIDRAKLDGSGISLEQLLRRMDQRLEAARKQLAQRGNRA